MSKFTVVHVDSRRDPEQIRRELARADAELVTTLVQSEDELIEATRQADGVIVGGYRITRRAIEQMERCRIIIRTGVGFEVIDLDAATERGIVVANVTDYCSEEVANHALALLLACSRKILRFDRAVRAGDRASVPLAPMGTLYGETLGLLALGNIGRAMARRGQALGMNVIAYDPYLDPNIAADMGVDLVPMDDLLRRSDYVSVHVPLSEKTYHMISHEQLRLMKPTAYIINTSRGGVIDEAALIEALNKGVIAGAGLDVVEKEPISPDNPLCALDNVVLTPHTAFYSDASLPRLLQMTGQAVADVLLGYWPRDVVNPEVKPRFPLKARPASVTP